MNLSPHFTYEEFIKSDQAARFGINNEIPLSLMADALLTAQMLERIRAHLSEVAGHEVPLDLTSVYRCLVLNHAIGSGDGSDHPKMAAADFKAPKFGTPYEVATELARVTKKLGIGQLIHEFGRWVHVSRLSPKNYINAIITIPRPSVTLVGIQRV